MSVQFTQEDPIGLAGGLNLYGFAGGDPVNATDPFGLCPPISDCLQKLANWGAQRGGSVGGSALNVAAGLNAVNDFNPISAAFDAGYNIGSGRLGQGGIGLAMTLVPIPGEGAAKGALSALMKDAAENPGAWRAVGAFTEAATRKGLKGGLSIQTIIENEAGDRLVQHTLLDKTGEVVEQHYRPMYKPRSGIDKL